MKVLWLDSNGLFEPFDKKEHAGKVYKFVYWSNWTDGKQEGLLIACGIEMLGNRPQHPELVSQAKLAQIPGIYEPPDGAGLCAEGEVKYWTSVSYEVETPEELRPVLIEELGLVNYAE